MVVDERDGVDRSLLNNRVVEYLGEIVVRSLIPSLLEVVVQRGVEEGELGA